jgi:hypothetical protein
MVGLLVAAEDEASKRTRRGRDPLEGLVEGAHGICTRGFTPQISRRPSGPGRKADQFVRPDLDARAFLGPGSVNLSQVNTDEITLTFARGKNAGKNTS